MLNHSRTFSGIYWGTLSSIGATVIQLVQLTILGRLLGADDFGLMAMAVVVLGIANAYADMGMSNAILTHQGITPQQLSSLYWLNWGVSIISALFVCLAAPLAALGFGESRLAPLVVWLALTLLIAPLGLQFQLLLQKELNLKPIALIEVVAGLLGLAVSVVSALNGQGAYALVYGSLTAAAAKATALYLVGFRRWPVTRHFALADVRPYIGFAAYQVGERTLNFAAWNLDKMMIGGLLGAQALGIYNLAYQLMQKPLQFVIPIVNRVVLPLFSSRADDLVRLRSSYLLVVEGVGLLLFPVFALMIVLSEPIILLLVGPNWMDAVPVFRWLALLGCLYAIGFPIGSLLLARHRADIAFWLNVFVIAVYALAVFVGSTFGIEGVAKALLCGQLVLLVLIGSWVRWKAVKMSPLEFIQSFTTPMLLASVAGLLTYLIGELLQEISVFSVAIGTILSICVMCSLYALLVAVFLKAPLMRVFTMYKNRNRAE